MYTPSTASGRRSRTDPDENCLISYTQYYSQKREQIQSAFQTIREMQENDKKSIRYPQLKIIQATSVINHLLTKYQAIKMQTYFQVVRQTKPENPLASINDVNLSPAVISRNRRHLTELLRQEQFKKGLKKIDKLFREKICKFKFQAFVSTFQYQITNNNSESYNLYQFTTIKQNDEDERIAIQFAGATQLITLISTLAIRQKMQMFLCINTQKKQITKKISHVDHDSLKLSAVCVLNSLFEKKLKSHLLQLKVHSFIFKQRNSTLIVSLKEAAHRKSQILGKLFQSVESELEQFLQSTNYTDSPKHEEEKRDSDLPADPCKKKMSQTAILPSRKVLSPINLTNSSHQSSSNTLDKDNEGSPTQITKSRKYLYLFLSQIVLFVVLISIYFI